MKEWLATEHGIMLVQPAYTRYHLELGEITTYPPGYKENGSIFCHVNPWIMIAETILGDGEAAFDYYKRTNPSARATIHDGLAAERDAPGLMPMFGPMFTVGGMVTRLRSADSGPPARAASLELTAG